jgi:hypothetical protein
MRHCRASFISALALLLLLAATPRVARADLRILETRHYVIHTDLERSLAEDLGRRMDAMFDDYCRRLADFSPDSRTKFEVYLFQKRQDYLTFTSNKVPNTGGVFMPSRNTLAAFLDGQGRDALRRTLQHEAFHQFAYSAINPDLPPWLNEGLATVFEEGIFFGRTFSLGQVPPRRVRQLQADMRARRLIPFRKMMAMSLDDWSVALSSGDGTRGATQYNQAWAMCHFLIFAGPPDQPTYRRRFLDLLSRIHAGVPGDRAFREAFSDNIDGFQQRFLEFVRGTLRPTPEATLIERQDVLADMLVALRGRGLEFDSIDALKHTLARGGYRMSYQKGDLKWQSDPDASTYFSNLDGEPLTRDEMYFEWRGGGDAPMPDLVLRAPRQIKLRTRFHRVPSTRKIEHEVLIDGPAR